MLKNAQNRTQKQQEQFEKIDHENFITAQVWKARENFKFVWESTDFDTLVSKINKWFDNTYRICNRYLTKAAQLIYKHFEGIANAILLKVNNAAHEHCNANIQRLIIKARGFKNFKRFRINLLFYYGKLKLVPQTL